jgi:hypothetical protein
MPIVTMVSTVTGLRLVFPAPVRLVAILVPAASPVTKVPIVVIPPAAVVVAWAVIIVTRASVMLTVPVMKAKVIAIPMTSAPPV